MSGYIEGEAEEIPSEEVDVPVRSTAIVVRDEISVAELVEQHDKVQEAMRVAMREDHHYGRIPGVPKPTLLKPGAEKLCVLFRLAPSYKSERIFHDDGHLTVVSTCELRHIPTGLIVSSGEGLCTSKETRYAYRNAEKVCPNCGQPAIIKGKEEYGGGWVCFKRKDGCGAKFSDNDARITDQPAGKVPNPDIPDTFNTVLKMADKRALVAAVLNGTAASDVFTQDVEDSTSSSRTTAPQVARQPVDPGTQLPTGFPAGDDLGHRVGEALRHVEPSVDWRETWETANIAVYGTKRASLDPDKKAESLYRLANVAERLTKSGGDFPQPTDKEIAAAFAYAFQGEVVEVVHVEQETQGDAPLGSGPPPEYDDSIEFGEPDDDAA